ncbi:MAG: nuclease, partial [Rhizobacter sp.]|nr:nuclease [Rhizobacter sp.]
MQSFNFARTAGLVVLLSALHSFAAAADTPIYAIQGSTASSPFAGQKVTTTGVVTKLNSNGFFIQDPQGDGNPATSDGIFVFSSTSKPAVGSLVRVSATVSEFNVGAAGNADTTPRPLTELSTVTLVSVLNTGMTIAPTPLPLPLAAGDTFERFEGMLVSIPGSLMVQQNYFQGRFGELTIGAGGRHETPTNHFRPGSAQAVALADEQARGRLLLDDGSSVQNPNPTPFQGANGTPRAGDTVSALVGTLDFGLATSSNTGLGLYRLNPTQAPAFTVTNPRPATPPAVGGNVRIASMNVLNFFTTFLNGNTATGQTGQGCSLGDSVAKSNCRGANDLGEFNRQRAKIVLALAGMNADAVGLMEIQNNGNVGVQNLVDALNAKVGANTYAAVPLPSTGTGTDAIRVAMIYKPSRLSAVGASISDPAAINNRPPFAQTFAAANGAKFTVVV